ncbi:MULTISPECIES: ABC transporter ATP-binding protein [Peptoniphilus]|uniref:ABC transporter ATP-binding protein n=1 Tax=Peptoniphilus TaxID=162289 RepID=UPI0001DA9DF2|nr:MULTISPECIES: ABC transporter ATP-binding protein [Peptoniphilus]EFI41461.1 ABC transporter, ATP-binding protein [Peptoniphilus sp. oral taxon 386 str. F0131]
MKLIYNRGCDIIETLISIKNLKRIYKMGNEKVFALNGIDLDIYKEEILCLLGTSGSGKSTLLNMMAGLDKPTSGEIIVGGVHLEKLNETQITKFRQLNVGFVFQSYNLISTLNALENVSLGMIFKGVPIKQRNALSEDILTKVGLGDRLYHKPSEMSGGQQQRVSIARAFVDKPPIMFADEPTGNLDTKTSFEIMNLMCQMARDYHQTLIIVTHDIETSVYADRIVDMRDGKIVSIKENQPKIPKA